MKHLALTALGLLGLALESAVAHAFGLEVGRADVAVVVVAFLASRAPALLPGALVAAALGYGLDVYSGRPSLLFPGTCVALFVAARAVGQVLDLRGRLAFSLFAGLASLLHAALALSLQLLTALSTGGFSVGGLPLQLLLTAVLAALLHPLLLRLEPVQRPSYGLLA